jgi:large subunit ribosomal protein L19
VYPEFLPDPRLDHRNKLREKLERMDMLNRRAHIDIPEFYVGKPVLLIYKSVSW